MKSINSKEENMFDANKEFIATGNSMRERIVRTRWAFLLVACSVLSFAQGSTPKSFASAEEAGGALLQAVQSNDQSAVAQVLGARNELLSSGDELQDKRDREQFVRKYQEMHRFVTEPDGNTFLYIGAENWPFPVPLVSKGGKWHFDADAGEQEIVFRQVGEDENVAIETCHALIRETKKQGNDSPANEVDRFVASFVESQAVSGKSTPAERYADSPFHGYYFRMLSPQSAAGSGAGNKATKGTFLAYPAQYKSSGVMTFVVTENGVVYEKDLGPNTTKVVGAISNWKPTATWHVTN